MPEEQKKHPLEEYSENEQIAYLSVLSAVCYVDKEFGDMEKRQLDVLLAQLKISDVGKAKIYSSVFNLQREDKLANLEAIQILGNTELKYTLISDLCLFSLVDSKFSDDEYQYILGIYQMISWCRSPSRERSFFQIHRRVSSLRSNKKTGPELFLWPV